MTDKALYDTKATSTARGNMTDSSDVGCPFTSDGRAYCVVNSDIVVECGGECYKAQGERDSFESNPMLEASMEV